MRIANVDVPPEFDAEPTRFGRFRVCRELGSGLTSRTFLAEDPHLGRQVAIKWLNPDACTGADSLHEARIVARLEHPNIVPLHEAGVFRRSPYLVFSYVSGSTLRELRDKGEPMSPDKALPLFRAILDGVACAHAQGILHLDLSPSNIIVDAAGVPRIMDFGQARTFGEGVQGDRGGNIVGTPRYMAPERILGQPLTAAADVYALGLILYELLTGRLAAPTKSVEAITETRTSAGLELEVLSGLEPRMKAFIQRAVNPAPAVRFADARDMKRALDALGDPSAQGRARGTVEFLIGRMERKANFPALSNNLVEINRLAGEDSHASIATLAKVVLRDYAVTNKLLKLANSAFYGRSAAGVSTVSEAIHRLGTRVVRIACNSLAYLDALRGGSARLRDALTSSFLSALIGRHLALQIGRPELAEEAFICGMFHTLGRCLVIFYFEDEFEAIESLVESRGVAQEAAAARVLGIGYSELGMAVAARWRLPATICESMRHAGPGPLARPESPDEARRQLAAFGSELCELAERCPRGQEDARLRAFAARFEALAGIAAGDLPALLGAALEKLAEFAPVIGLQLASNQFFERAGGFLAALAMPREPAPHA